MEISKGVVIVSGTHTNGVDLELSRLLGLPRVAIEAKLFPDGESYVRIPSLEGAERAIVVQTMYPQQDKRFVEALLIAEALQGLGVREVILVAPYIPYARQDRRFLDGEPISIKVVLRALRSGGVSTLVTVDLHKEDSLKWFEGRSVNVDPSPVLAEALQPEKREGDLVVIAPDRGALERARRVATRLGVKYDYLEKFRDRVTGEVTYKPKSVNVKEKVVALVDDMISTGGTIAKAASMLYEQGARRVVAACTHGLFVGNAMEKLRKADVKRVVATNTIPTPHGVEVVSVAPVLAETLRQLLGL